MICRCDGSPQILRGALLMCLVLVRNGVMYILANIVELRTSCVRLMFSSQNHSERFVDG